MPGLTPIQQHNVDCSRRALADAERVNAGRASHGELCSLVGRLEESLAQSLMLIAELAGGA